MENDYKLKDYLLCVSRMPDLERYELEEALTAASNGQLSAKRLLEERHLRFVVACCLPYRPQPVPFLRLIEAGNRALLKLSRGWNGHDPEAFRDALQAAVEQACEDEARALRR